MSVFDPAGKSRRRRTGSLALGLGMILGSSPLRATTIRLESLGESLLVQDDQEDLRGAGVFIHDLTGRRFYGDGSLDGTYSKRIDSVSGQRSSDASSGFGMDGQYVDARGSRPWAVSAGGGYDSAPYVGGGATYERGGGPAGAILGFGGPGAWKTAAAASYSYEASRNAHQTSRAWKRTELAQLSAASGPKGRKRLIVMLDAALFDNHYLALSVPHDADRNRRFTLSGLWEVPGRDGSLWRGLGSLSHVRETDVPAQGRPYTDDESVLTAGAAKTLKTSRGALFCWFGSLSCSRQDDTPSTGRELYRAQELSSGIGVEFPLTDRFVFRAKDSVVHVTRSSTSSAFIRRTVWNWDTNASKVLGVGYRPSPTLSFDFLLGDLSLSGTDNMFVSSSVRRTDLTRSVSVFLSGAVEWRFL